MIDDHIVEAIQSSLDMQNYQEDSNSIFLSDGKRYLLNAILLITDNKPIREVPIDDLKWVLEFDKVSDQHRIDSTDTDIPIIVTQHGNKVLIVDGAHRLKKIIQLDEHDTMQVKWITVQELARCEIKPNQLTNDKSPLSSISIVAKEQLNPPHYSNW